MIHILLDVSKSLVKWELLLYIFSQPISAIVCTYILPIDRLS
jgi:hypothetical protein